MPQQRIQCFIVEHFTPGSLDCQKPYRKCWRKLCIQGWLWFSCEACFFLRPNLFSLANDYGPNYNDQWHLGAQQEMCYGRPIYAMPFVAVTGFLGMFYGGWFLFMLQSMDHWLFFIFLFFCDQITTLPPAIDKWKITEPFFWWDLSILLTPFFCLLHLTA